MFAHIHTIASKIVDKEYRKRAARREASFQDLDAMDDMQAFEHIAENNGYTFVGHTSDDEVTLAEFI